MVKEKKTTTKETREVKKAAKLAITKLGSTKKLPKCPRAKGKIPMGPSTREVQKEGHQQKRNSPKGIFQGHHLGGGTSLIFL
jgi:hypothetical protein